MTELPRLDIAADVPIDHLLFWLFAPAMSPHSPSPRHISSMIRASTYSMNSVRIFAFRQVWLRRGCVKHLTVSGLAKISDKRKRVDKARTVLRTQNSLISSHIMSTPRAG